MIIDEKFFQFLWNEQLLDLKDLTSTIGRRIKVLDPGVQNVYGGPDFLQAKISIDGMVFHGSIELHIKSSMWNLHGHQSDKAYDNVILHVVLEDDLGIVNSLGHKIETIELKEQLQNSYLLKLNSDHLGKDKAQCAQIISDMSSISRLSFFDRLFLERIEEKVDYLLELKRRRNYCWNKVLLHQLAKTMAYSNSQLMTDLVDKIEIRDLLQIRHSPLKVEAYLQGVAGFLHQEFIDEYNESLVAEFEFLKVKYQLDTMDKEVWNKGRVRVYTTPKRVIGYLSVFISKHLHDWSSMLDEFSIKEFQALLLRLESKYWSHSFDFGRMLNKENSFFNSSRVNLLIVNVFVPIYLAIYKDKSDGEFLEEMMTLKPEVNNILKSWKQKGVDVKSLWDSQAILQLDKQYCSRNKCLSCKIGRSILKDGKVGYQNKKANGSPILWGLSVVG